MSSFIQSDFNWHQIEIFVIVIRIYRLWGMFSKTAKAHRNEILKFGKY